MIPLIGTDFMLCHVDPPYELLPVGHANSCQTFCEFLRATLSKVMPPSWEQPAAMTGGWGQRGRRYEGPAPPCILLPTHSTLKGKSSSSVPHGAGQGLVMAESWLTSFCAHSCFFHLPHWCWTCGHHRINLWQVDHLLWVCFLGTYTRIGLQQGKEVQAVEMLHVAMGIWKQPRWLPCTLQHVSRSPISYSRGVCREWKWILIVACAVHN